MTYMIMAILAMTLATVITRAFPFLLFSRRNPPEKLIRTARLIPAVVMVVLVFTSLPMSFSSAGPELWIPWMSVALVALLHILFRHPLISIAGGTAVYMFCSHWFL